MMASRVLLSAAYGLLVVLLSFLVCCNKPPIVQHNSPTTLFISFEPGFTGYELRLFHEALPSFSTMDIRFVVTDNPGSADLIVKPWYNPDYSDGRVGLYPGGTNYVMIATSRLETDEQFRAILLHEIGHWMGLSHVCLFADVRDRSDCSPVGVGEAVMNPVISSQHVQQFTTLDIAEFHRSINRRR